MLFGYNENTSQKKTQRCKGSVSHLTQFLCQCVNNVHPVLKHSCGAWRLCLCWLVHGVICIGGRHNYEWVQSRSLSNCRCCIFYFAAFFAWMKPKTFLGELFSLCNLQHKGNHGEYINGSYRDYSSVCSNVKRDALSLWVDVYILWLCKENRNTSGP